MDEALRNTMGPAGEQQFVNEANSILKDLKEVDSDELPSMALGDSGDKKSNNNMPSSPMQSALQRKKTNRVSQQLTMTKDMAAQLRAKNRKSAFGTQNAFRGSMGGDPMRDSLD